MTTARGGDASLRALRAEAKRDPSASTLLRLAHALARAGAWDEAARQGTIAAATLDASDLWDALTPPLDALEASTRTLPVRPQGASWTFEGGLVGVVHGEKGGMSITEVDLAAGAARTVVRSARDRVITFNGTHATLDPRGRIVVFACGAGNVSAVHAARRDTGELLARIEGNGVRQLVVTGDGRLVWLEDHRLRVFGLDAEGRLTRARALAVSRGDDQLVSSTGALARQTAAGVELLDLGEKTPRARIAAGLTKASALVGRRLVTWAGNQAVRLHGADGALLAEVAVAPTGEHVRRIASPSGRLVALVRARDPRSQPSAVELVDLRTGERRAHACRGALTVFRWSPSGRALIGLPHDWDSTSSAPGEAFVLEAR